MRKEGKAIVDGGDLSTAISNTIDTECIVLYAWMKECLVVDCYGWDAVHENRQHELVGNDTDEKRFKKATRLEEEL